MTREDQGMARFFSPPPPDHAAPIHQNQISYHWYKFDDLWGPIGLEASIPFSELEAFAVSVADSRICWKFMDETVLARIPTDWSTSRQVYNTMVQHDVPFAPAIRAYMQNHWDTVTGVFPELKTSEYNIDIGTRP